MTRMAEIEARMLEIRSLLEGDTEVDLDALETELRGLVDEKAAIEKRKQMFESINIQPRKADPTPEPAQ